jgi:hypothetical protein
MRGAGRWPCRDEKHVLQTAFLDNLKKALTFCLQHFERGGHLAAALRENSRYWIPGGMEDSKRGSIQSKKR